MQTAAAVRPAEVIDVLAGLGLGHHALRFEQERVDLPALLACSDADMQSLGLVLGERKKLLAWIAGRSPVARDVVAPQRQPDSSATSTDLRQTGSLPSGTIPLKRFIASGSALLVVTPLLTSFTTQLGMMNLLGRERYAQVSRLDSYNDAVGGNTIVQTLAPIFMIAVWAWASRSWSGSVSVRAVLRRSAIALSAGVSLAVVVKGAFVWTMNAQVVAVWVFVVASVLVGGLRRHFFFAAIPALAAHNVLAPLGFMADGVGDISDFFSVSHWFDVLVIGALAAWAFNGYVQPDVPDVGISQRLRWLLSPPATVRFLGAPSASLNAAMLPVPGAADGGLSIDLMRRCRFCAESISVDSARCPFCAELVEKDAR
jgi:hypothetical protein